MNSAYRHVALGLAFQAAAVAGIGGCILLLRRLTGGLDAGSGWLTGAGLVLQIQGALLLSLIRLWGRAIPDWVQPTGWARERRSCCWVGCCNCCPPWNDGGDSAEQSVRFDRFGRDAHHVGYRRPANPQAEYCAMSHHGIPANHIRTGMPHKPMNRTRVKVPMMGAWLMPRCLNK